MRSFWHKIRGRFGIKWILWAMFLLFVSWDSYQSQADTNPFVIFSFGLVVPWAIHQYRHRGGRRSKVKLQGKNLKLFSKSIHFKTSLFNSKTIIVRFRDQGMIVGDDTFLIKDITSISMNFEKRFVYPLERVVLVISSIIFLVNFLPPVINWFRGDIWVILEEVNKLTVQSCQSLQSCAQSQAPLFFGFLFDSMGSGKWIVLFTFIFMLGFPIIVRLLFSQIFSFTTIQGETIAVKTKYPIFLYRPKEDEFKKSLKKLNKYLAQ